MLRNIFVAHVSREKTENTLVLLTDHVSHAKDYSKSAQSSKVATSYMWLLTNNLILFILIQL